MSNHNLSINEIMMLALNSIDNNATATIYSYQHPTVLEQLNNIGYISGSQSHRFDLDINDGRPYDWMKEQMVNRVSNYSGDLPIWGWTKKESQEEIDKTKELIEIVAEVPWGRILMSDFDLWHYILNNQYLALNEKEFDLMGDCSIEEKEKSWERIFKFNWRETIEQETWFRNEYSVQLCIDRIYKDEIKLIIHPK